MSPPDVSVIVAATDPTPTLASCLAGFLREVGDAGEVVVVAATDAPIAAQAGLRVARRPAGSLAPELWRDGLEATRAPLVAFTTAAMVPAPGWLAALRSAMLAGGAAAVGGPIVPGEGLKAMDRSVYLFRYIKYINKFINTIDPPGDNCLYRRDRLVGLERLWREGFWEVPILHALRERGEPLALVPDAVLTYSGGAKLGPTLRQRWRHARRFGAERAAGEPATRRLARSLAAPAVPAVLAGRAVGELRRCGEPLSPWGSATAAFGVVAATWAIGEAVGTWFGPTRRRA